MSGTPLTFLGRLDGWVNTVLKIGTSEDRAAWSRFAPSVDISDQELASLYDGNDLAQTIVAIVPEEVFRQGVKIEHPEKVRIIERARMLQLLNKMQQGMIWGRLFGGGVLVHGFDDGQEMTEPFNSAAFRGYEYIDVYDKRHVHPERWYADRDHPKYKLPAIFRINDPDGGITYVHETRMTIFGGAHTTINKRRERMGWDLSILQKLLPIIQQFDNTHSALENLVYDLSVGVYKLKGLTGLLGRKGGKEALASRASTMDLWRSVTRSVLLDADGGEDYNRVSASMSGIEGFATVFVNRLAMGARIPVTVLAGQAPAGLNATGQADMRNFYDRIATERTQIQPDVERCFNWIARSLGSEEPVKLTWPSLWQESPQEKATREKLEADKDTVDINAGVITPDESCKRRYADDPYVDQNHRPPPPPREPGGLDFGP